MVVAGVLMPAAVAVVVMLIGALLAFVRVLVMLFVPVFGLAMRMFAVIVNRFGDSRLENILSVLCMFAVVMTGVIVVIVFRFAMGMRAVIRMLMARVIVSGSMGLQDGCFLRLQ